MYASLIFAGPIDTALLAKAKTDMQLVYNRVPKCGSTTLLRMMQQSSKIYNFTYIGVTTFTRTERERYNRYVN